MSPLRRVWISARIDIVVAWFELMKLIDSRTVRLFQALMYFGWLLFGLYAITFSEPVSVVDTAMGSVSYAVWVWVNLLGPLMVIVGCWMAWPRRVNQPTRRVANGLLLQAFGDFAVMMMLAAMWASLLYSAWWGKGTHALFTYVCLSICALLLLIGDLRRLIVHSEWRK